MTKCDFTTEQSNIPTEEGQFTGIKIVHDNVHNPSHYQGKYGMESIDVLRNFMTSEQLKGFYLGNALKYQLRYQKKNGLEDLKKARKNLDWLIEEVEKMNNEKVYVEGDVVGFVADTTGTREKQIQVSSGEIVSIDEGFIHKSIAPEKVTIPQFVADWIEKRKRELSIREAMSQAHVSAEVDDWLMELDEDGAFLNQDLFARAWLDGYEVEKEPKYKVKFKGVLKNNNYLNYNSEIKNWYHASSLEIGMVRTKFTRKELEEASFGWVFDCPGVEIEEVEE